MPKGTPPNQGSAIEHLHEDEADRRLAIDFAQVIAGAVLQGVMPALMRENIEPGDRAKLAANNIFTIAREMVSEAKKPLKGE